MLKESAGFGGSAHIIVAICFKKKSSWSDKSACQVVVLFPIRNVKCFGEGREGRWGKRAKFILLKSALIQKDCGVGEGGGGGHMFQTGIRSCVAKLNRRLKTAGSSYARLDTNGNRCQFQDFDEFHYVLIDVVGVAYPRQTGKLI